LQINSLLRNGQNEKAAAELSDWILEYNEDSERRITMAQYLASFDQVAAIPVMEQLSQDYPWSGEVTLLTAQLHLASGKPENAIPYYESLVQFGEHRNIALFSLGRIYEQKGETANLRKAKDYYSLVENIDEDSNNTASNEPRANIVFEAGIREARLAYQLGGAGFILFNELRHAYPEQRPLLYQEEGRILMQNPGTVPESISILSEGINQFSTDEGLLYLRSIAYERQHNVDAAIADLQEILLINPENTTALNGLGYTLANRTDRYDEAFALISKALLANPEDAPTLDSMGWVLFKMEKYEEAHAYLSAAHERFFDQEIISHLAQVLVKLDRSKEAKELLETSLLKIPDSTMIPETLDMLEL